MPFRAMRNGFRAFRPYFVGVLAPSHPGRAFSQQIPNRFSGCTAKQSSSWLCMTKNVFEVKRGNVVVKVYERHRIKSERSYTEFIVDDRSSGGRKLWTRSTLAQAKEKAAEVAEAIQKGNVQASQWESGLRLELRKALETLEPTGMGILPACQIMVQAVRILGNPDDLLATSQHWKTHRPEKPVVATSIERAVEAYKASRKLRISGRRYRTEESYFRKVLKEFSGKPIHEIMVDDFDLLVGRQKWVSKTRNDFLTSVSPIFEFAARRNWVPKDHNPVKGVARAREAQPYVEIFEPSEMNQMIKRLTVIMPDAGEHVILAVAAKDQFPRLHHRLPLRPSSRFPDPPGSCPLRALIDKVATFSSASSSRQSKTLCGVFFLGLRSTASLARQLQRKESA